MPKRLRKLVKPKSSKTVQRPKRFNPSGATRKEIASQFARQKARDKAERSDLAARRAAKTFRPRKGDRGKLILIGIKGQRNPQAKGRKGYLAYVSAKGKVSLVREKDSDGKSKTYRPEKISNVQVPFQKRFKNKTKDFQSARLVTIKRGKTTRPVIRGSGNVTTGGSAYDFNETVVNKIALNIQKAISSVKSHRIFLVNVNILIRLPDGTTQVFSFGVPIERPDHVAIKLGGIINWLQKKFYASMANELRYAGLVSSGSANHIRRLNENYGTTKPNWTQADEPWRGQDLEIVKILTIEWKIEQSK